MTTRRSIGAVMLAVALSVTGCAFMFESPNLDNPLDASVWDTRVWEVNPIDPSVTARRALLEKVSLKSTPIGEARAYLESLGAKCEHEADRRMGYLCVYERVFPFFELFPFSIVRRAVDWTYHIRLVEAAGKLDDISVEVERKMVDYWS